MKALERAIQFIKGETSPFDSFEQSVIEHIANALPDADRKVLLDQISRINSLRRLPLEFGNEEIYLYWKDWGTVRRDFPLKFKKTSEEESRLAAVSIESPSGSLVVELWIVEGAIYLMKILAPNDECKPLNPYYRVTSLSVQPQS